MIVIFVHGWSVNDTRTYGELPQWLATQPGPDGQPFQTANIYLGRYISFDDTVTLDDLGRAFEQAIRDELAPQLRAGERFACITHSTGGPVVRNWINLCHRSDLRRCPLSHLIMLAPANHGSALAQLGKSRLARVKCFLQDTSGGYQPGQRVLDWLELGSEPSWQLNRDWLDFDLVKQGLFPFVLTGQRIDRSLYDALNSYTDEPGSDGVVRVAAANLNYGYLRLVQQGITVRPEVRQRTAPTALGVLPGLAHSGETMGIIRSVRLDNADTHPTAQWVLRCLGVANSGHYSRLAKELSALTESTQEAERKERSRGLFPRTYITSRYSMVLFRVVDDRGEALSDYDLFITAGPVYSEQDLPPGFFVDRQRNRLNPGKLTYYLDHDVLSDGLARAKIDGKLGFRVRARPDEKPGERLAFYRELDYRSTFDTLSKYLAPNETLMIELVLERHLDKAVFRIANNEPPGPFTRTPTGTEIDWTKPIQSGG